MTGLSHTSLLASLSDDLWGNPSLPADQTTAGGSLCIVSVSLQSRSFTQDRSQQEVFRGLGVNRYALLVGCLLLFWMHPICTRCKAARAWPGLCVRACASVCMCKERMWRRVQRGLLIIQFTTRAPAWQRCTFQTHGWSFHIGMNHNCYSWPSLTQRSISSDKFLTTAHRWHHTSLIHYKALITPFISS